MKTKSIVPVLVILLGAAGIWLPGALRAQGLEQVLKSFGYPEAANPEAALMQGSDGALYGTTQYGGTYNYGTVFKLSTNGSAYSILYSFTGTAGDGALPHASLIQGSDGALYGTTESGGNNSHGTVFKLNTNGSGYSVLHGFASSGGDGASPLAGLVQGSDGALYGAASEGGAYNYGTVFKLGTNGSAFSVLYRFTGSGGDGASPLAGLVQGSDGALYGTTASGGTNGAGVIFRLSTNALGYQVLYDFTATQDGAGPNGLILGSDGALYGTTQVGGTNNNGTVFKLSTNGSGYSVLYSFIGEGGDGANPRPGLIQGGEGALYGTTQRGGTNNSGTIFKLSTNGSGYSVLHSFTDTDGDGALPNAGLIQGSDGALYGTTASGGTNYGTTYLNSTNYGTVFKLSTSGSGYTILNIFTGAGGDGANPGSGLIVGSDGALYGRTPSGGFNGAGTVYKLNTNGSGYTILYNFTGLAGAGAPRPQAGLMQGSDGALYSTTESGGSNNYGTVFKLSTDGSGYLVLHSFTGPDGAYPYAGLIQGSDGALYGTTESGGSNDYGTVFKLGTDGSGYLVLHSFTGGLGGANPYEELIQGSDGMLYGTTSEGGRSGYGTVFKLSTNGLDFGSYSLAGGASGLIQGSDGALYGTAGGNRAGAPIVFKLSTNGLGYQVLYSFSGLSPNGLLQGSDGELYGTTESGGTNSYGTVFALSANGSNFNVLYSFSGAGADGAYPSARLMQSGRDALYGTTFQGGVRNLGTVFRFVSEPLIDTQPQNAVVVVGGSASFSISASGIPAPAYSWQFNGTNLVNGGQLSGTDSRSLVISGVTLANAGNYTVIVTNAYGSHTSSVASLTVLSPRISNIALSGSGNVILSFFGSPNTSSRLWATTNLALPSSWQPIFTNTVTTTNGMWGFIDTNASKSSARFYLFSTP